MTSKPGLSNNELSQLCKHVRYFEGVYDKSWPAEIPTNRPSTYIINTAKMEEGGVHWIAFHINPYTKLAFLFDSYGFNSADLKKYYNYNASSQAKRLRCTLILNDRCCQEANSAYCGVFCVWFVLTASRFPMSSFLSQYKETFFTCPPDEMTLYENKLRHNEQIVLWLLKKQGVELTSQMKSFI